MECVNHPGSQVAAYCQNCGRGICAECVAAWSQRPESRGLVLCPACVGLMQSPPPIYVPPVSSGPSPAAAAALGLIPGVGAMYNGQFLKGLIHVVIFAVLISITGHYGIFGIFIAAWVVYQSFEAYHTAKARRDGLPLPDPFGLNELSNWMNPTGHVHTAVPPVPPVPPQQPGAQVPPPFSGGAPQQPWGAGWQQPPYPPPPLACRRFLRQESTFAARNPSAQSF